ncbi:Lysosomal/Vacuolar Amino Acid Transporter 1 [Abortiporus biennis]
MFSTGKMLGDCIPHNDRATSILTAVIIVGMTISYLPQHYRIIHAKSSEGFSPWFLLLGSTSSASGMLNIIVMQWSIIKCCRELSFGNCIESTAGIFQLGLQWYLFTVILVLYMIYYPPHLKYVAVNADVDEARNEYPLKTSVKSDEWRLSIVLSWVTLVHLLFITFVTFLLLSTSPSPDPMYGARQLSLWATFLGLSSALLAALQYAPQIIHTYRAKLVGALSIKMMLIQTPGAVFMVLSIALRPGTNWTTWLPYAVAGALQGTLLIMCIFWHRRQHRLGLDDFGRSLSGIPEDDSPVSITRGPDEDLLVSEAVHIAVESDMREDHDVTESTTSEATPLLGGKSEERASWFKLPWSR